MKAQHSLATKVLSFILCMLLACSSLASLTGCNKETNLSNPPVDSNTVEEVNTFAYTPLSSAGNTQSSSYEVLYRERSDTKLYYWLKIGEIENCISSEQAPEEFKYDGRSEDSFTLTLTRITSESVSKTVESMTNRVEYDSNLAGFSREIGVQVLASGGSFGFSEQYYQNYLETQNAYTDTTTEEKVYSEAYTKSYTLIPGVSPVGLYRMLTVVDYDVILFVERDAANQNDYKYTISLQPKSKFKTMLDFTEEDSFDDSYKEFDDVNFDLTIIPSLPSFEQPYISMTTQQPSNPIADGSKENPYLISNASQFRQMVREPDKCFKLTNDIDFNNQSFSLEGEFTGHFDGNGYSIKNLTVKSQTTYAALFENNKGTIVDLKIEDSTFEITPSAKDTYFAYAAGIAAKNEGVIDTCVVRNCTIIANGTNLSANFQDKYGVISKNLKQGGEYWSAWIGQSYDATNRADYHAYAGGICAYNTGTVMDCTSACKTVDANLYYNNGEVNTQYVYAGGICGYNDGGSIKLCTNSSQVCAYIDIFDKGGDLGWAKDIYPSFKMYAAGICGYVKSGLETGNDNRGVILTDYRAFAGCYWFLVGHKQYAEGNRAKTDNCRIYTNNIAVTD